MIRDELTTIIASKLDLGVKDYCPNGLQVAGVEEIKKIIVGVSASQVLLERALAKGADAVIVHHGLFWRGDLPVVVGPLRVKLQLLLAHGINLYAYHLPLDFNLEVGNNVMLAQELGWDYLNSYGGDIPVAFGKVGKCSLDDFASGLADNLAHQPLVISGGGHQVENIAWCTGAGGDFLARLKLMEAGVGKFDTYITGEIAERHVHLARELGVHLVAAGHHATERYGVQALARWLATDYNLSCEFIDEFVPV